MKRVHIRRDVYNKDTWTVENVEDICAYLSEQFTVFPENARIYHGAVAQKNDVTPIDERSIRHLQNLEGEFYVVIYPAELLTIIYWAVVALTAALSIYTYMTMPKIRQSAAPSPNNELSSRQNSARLGGRIPEIFGQVRSYPDLISETYTYYNSDGVEVERSLLCIGRGYYQIHEVKDASTDISDLSGTSVSIYNPNTSIIGTPIYQSGRSFTDLPWSVIKSDSITGQTLDYPNDAKVESNELYFTADGKIHKDTGGLDTYFSAGDSIMISGAEFGTLDRTFSGSYELNTGKKIVFESPFDYQNINEYQAIELKGALVEIVTINEIPPVPPETESTYIESGVYKDFSGRYIVSSIIKTIAGGGFNYQVFLSAPEAVNPSWGSLNENKTIDAALTLTDNSAGIYLDDTYSVQSVTPTEVTLANPAVVNSEWNDLAVLQNQSTKGMAKLVNLDKISNKWVGWHNIFKDDAERVVINLHFPQGIYRQNSKGGTSATYTDMAFEYQCIDKDGNPKSEIYRYNKRFDGATRVAFGSTINLNLPVKGSIRFRACKTRASNPNNEQATMNIRDVYLSSQLDISNYGDVTIVQSEAIGSDGLYAIKERKLNCLVTRKLPLNGTGALTATKSAAQALIYLALDNRNGRRNTSEVDIAQILAEEQEVIHYFNNPKAAEFSYTIDDENLAFEEIAGMIASACFSEPTRFGSKLRLHFEQPKNTPVLLFNHRNKVPRSEKRTYSFGVNKDYDGIEFEYTSSDDDARVTYLIPLDGSAKNPMSIKSSGIRTEEQAKTRAWREWNKLFYQRISCKFDALDESNLLVRNDPILIADNVMVDTQDGEVKTVNGLTLGLSQRVEILAGDSIYLQMPDGTVDLIGCQKGTEPNQIILNRAPLLPLVVENDRYVKTTYQIVRAGEASKSMFVLTEMTPQAKMINSLTCVNYDSRYYEKDHSFF